MSTIKAPSRAIIFKGFEEQRCALGIFVRVLRPVFGRLVYQPRGETEGVHLQFSRGADFLILIFEPE